jgi:hypothetical protein
VAHFHFQFIDLGEHIRRQSVYSGKLLHGALLTPPCGPEMII